MVAPFYDELELTNSLLRPSPPMAASVLSSPLLRSPRPRYYPTARPRIPTSSPLKLDVRGHGGWRPVSVKSRFDELPLGLRSSDSGFGIFDGCGRRKSEALRGGGCRLVCGYQVKEENQSQNNGPDWPILKRWEVPWEWPTVSLTMLACGLSFILTGLLETAVAPFVVSPQMDLSLDDKAGILFVDQLIVTGVVLGVIFGISNRFKPLPDDIFRYKISDPFSLEDGWLLWAVVGFVVAIIAIALLGAGLALFSGESPQRETDALVRLSPLIGSSTVSTAFLVGITGVLAPILEETVFRGYLMVSLTKWVPTPISVLLTAAIFAVAHLTPGEIPQLFVLGTVLGFSYAHTRNLVTPITIHAFWNSGVILLLTFLQLQGYDIKELIQGP